VDRYLERDGVFAGRLSYVAVAAGNAKRGECHEPRQALQESTEANRGIDFTVQTGEVIAILGPNGAGKTTFLRQLTTELMPTSGKIEVFGVDVVAEPQKAKLLMGITPQESGFFETLTVKQHLELFGKLKGLKTDESRAQTAELLTALDLENDVRKLVASCQEDNEGEF